MARRTNASKGTEQLTQHTVAPPVAAFADEDPSAPGTMVALTWDGVGAALGAPTDVDRDMYAVDLDPDERLGLGRRITSAKILTDLLRWSGDIAAWLGRTPAAEVGKLVGFSVGHVRVAFAEGLRLRSMLARFEGRAAAAEVEQGGADVGVDRAAKAVRQDYDVLYTALEHATKRNAVLRGMVTTAYSKAVTPRPLAAAVALLVPLAREALRGKDARVAARLAHEQVTLELVAALELGGKALEVAGAQSARAVGGVTERDLDLQDGTCLTHMQWLYDFFGNLHDRDPSAPHLVANATRSFFGPHARGKASAPASPADDTPKQPV